MEFFVNLGDWPLVRKTDSQIPILSWCGSDDTSDIVMPTYDLTEATLETMGRLVIVQPTPWGEGGESAYTHHPPVHSIFGCVTPVICFCHLFSFISLYSVLFSLVVIFLTSSLYRDSEYLNFALKTNKSS